MVQRKARTLLPQYLGLYRISACIAAKKESRQTERNAYLLVTRNVVSGGLDMPVALTRQLTGRPTQDATSVLPAELRLQLGERDRERLLETLHG